MGGRGSSGEGSRSFSAPTMSGSEKQVSWAKDIIETPYRNLGQRAESAAIVARRFESTGGKAADYRAEEAAYRSAQTEYARRVGELASRATGGLAASQVINKRNVFQTLADQIAQDQLRRRKS